MGAVLRLFIGHWGLLIGHSFSAAYDLSEQTSSELQESPQPADRHPLVGCRDKNLPVCSQQCQANGAAVAYSDGPRGQRRQSGR